MRITIEQEKEKTLLHNATFSMKGKYYVLLLLSDAKGQCERSKIVVDDEYIEMERRGLIKIGEQVVQIETLYQREPVNVNDKIPKAVIDKVIETYKVAKGYKIDDKNWNNLYWARNVKPAKKLITFFGNAEKACECIKYFANEYKKTNLEWSLCGAILNNAQNYKFVMEQKEKKETQLKKETYTLKEEEKKRELFDKEVAEMLKSFNELSIDERNEIRERAELNARKINLLYARSELAITHEIYKIMKGENYKRE